MLRARSSRPNKGTPNGFFGRPNNNPIGFLSWSFVWGSFVSSRGLIHAQSNLGQSKFGVPLLDPQVFQQANQNSPPDPQGGDEHGPNSKEPLPQTSLSASPQHLTGARPCSNPKNGFVQSHANCLFFIETQIPKLSFFFNGDVISHGNCPRPFC